MSFAVHPRRYSHSRIAPINSNETRSSELRSLAGASRAHSQETSMATQIGTTAVNLGAADVVDRAIYRRAVEAVIWGMPAVNYDLLYQAMVN